MQRLTEQAAQPSQAVIAQVKKQPQVETLLAVENASERSKIFSQTDFCRYLGEDSSNVASRARRRGLSTEDYLKTIALELKQEIWKREPGAKGKWLKQSN